MFVFTTMQSVTLPSVESADHDDITASLTGDGEAFRRLIERHQNEIARRMRKFSRDPGVIEELVHQTFVEAWLGLKNYRGDAPFVNWLHRIAVRTGFRLWKAKKSAKAIESINDRQIAAQPASQADDADALHRVLDRLSPRDRLVVTLLYLEEHSVEKTARLTGWSKTMVKVQAFRARAKLRKMMEERR